MLKSISLNILNILIAIFNYINRGFPGSSNGKEFACSAEDPGWSLGQEYP